MNQNPSPEPMPTGHGSDAAASSYNPLTDGHVGPGPVDRLVSTQLETSFTETRALRHDGWTPDKMRKFLETLAETAVVAEACRAVRMSGRSAYNLRNRDLVFAAGWDAALLALGRRRLADELVGRAMQGVVEQIWKDGEVVAERHRFDNRLAMAVLTRLDNQLERAERGGRRCIGAAIHWDRYLEALGAGDSAEAEAIVDGRDAASETARNRELHELHRLAPAGEGAFVEEEEENGDPHEVWQDGLGDWETDYPPPPGFQGEEWGEYGADGYHRTLTPEEQAAMKAQEEAGKPIDLSGAIAQRDAFFGLGDDACKDGGEGEARREGGTAPGG